MKLSDQLTRLAARTKELEDGASAFNAEARADLELDVKAARDAAQESAEALRGSVESGRSELSSWWSDMGRAWEKHVTTVRSHVSERLDNQELAFAQLAATRADEDASYAIDYAYAAVEEAEYAVLQANLAHLDADELAAEMRSS